MWSNRQRVVSNILPPSLISGEKLTKHVLDICSATSLVPFRKEMNNATFLFLLLLKNNHIIQMAISEVWTPLVSKVTRLDDSDDICVAQLGSVILSSKDSGIPGRFMLRSYECEWTNSLVSLKIFKSHTKSVLQSKVRFEFVGTTQSQSAFTDQWF